MTNFEIVRHELTRTTYPLKFDPLSWSEYSSNCYSYALGAKVDFYFLVGDLIGKRVTSHTPEEEKISILKEELQLLGFTFFEIDVDDEIPEDYYKIYFQIFDATGKYHFLRQDLDGLWSHRGAYGLPDRTDTSGTIITDPEAMLDCPFHGYCLAIKFIM
jgi:hypothetical protein